MLILMPAPMGVWVVQNGIVENFVALRERLQGWAMSFSDTDTETIVHLIHRHYHNGSG